MPKLLETTRATRRERILRAAVTCFARTGYHGATMEDIAAEAGIAKGAAYGYFSSKVDLFLALYDDWDCSLGEEIAAALARLAPEEQRSPRRMLVAALTATGQHVQTHPEHCRVLMEARALAPYEPTIASRVRAAEERAQRRLEEPLRAGIAAGEWSTDTDVALRARLIRAAQHGLMAQWHLAPGSVAWEHAAQALIAW